MNTLARGLNRHRLVATILFWLIILDVCSTSLVLGSYPGAASQLELNPLGRLAWALGGPFGLLGLKLIGIGSLLVIFGLEGRYSHDRIISGAVWLSLCLLIGLSAGALIVNIRTLLTLA